MVVVRFRLSTVPSPHCSQPLRSGPPLAQLRTDTPPLLAPLPPLQPACRRPKPSRHTGLRTAVQRGIAIAKAATHAAAVLLVALLVALPLPTSPALAAAANAAPPQQQPAATVSHGRLFRYYGRASAAQASSSAAASADAAGGEAPSTVETGLPSVNLRRRGLDAERERQSGQSPPP